LYFRVAGWDFDLKYQKWAASPLHSNPLDDFRQQDGLFVQAEGVPVGKFTTIADRSTQLVQEIAVTRALLRVNRVSVANEHRPAGAGCQSAHADEQAKEGCCYLHSLRVKLEVDFKSRQIFRPHDDWPALKAKRGAGFDDPLLGADGFDA
jgi:hypothetical protein